METTQEKCDHRFGAIVPGVEKCSKCGVYKDELETAQDEDDEVTVPDAKVPSCGLPGCAPSLGRKKDGL